MRTRIERIRQLLADEGGKVLVLALVLLAMGGLVLAPLLGLMNTGLLAGRTYENKTTELYAADAGVEAAIHWLIHGKQDGWGWVKTEEKVWIRDDDDRLQINDRQVTVTVEELEAANTFKVTSRITGPETGTTVMSTLWAIHVIQGCMDVRGPQTTFQGDVYVTEDVTITVGGQVDGNLIIGGDLTMEQQSKIEGDISVTGDAIIHNSAMIEGNICAGGDVTLHNSAQILGDVYVGGNFIFYNNTLVAGDVFILGNIIMNQKGDITGNVYAYGDITIKLDHPNAKIHGDVYATGTVTIDPAGRAGNVGTIHEDQDPDDYPEQPDCPNIPASPTKIHTYEIS